MSKIYVCMCNYRCSMPLRAGRRPNKRPKKSSNGWGKSINLRFDREEYPKAVEALKVRTQEEFEHRYKMSFGKNVQWNSFASKVTAILEWFAEREEKGCQDIISNCESDAVNR